MIFSEKIKEIALRFGSGIGDLPTYAWPGGYPVFYLVKCSDGCFVEACPDCVNLKDPAWEEDEVVEYYIYYEGPPTICEFCSKEIKSAYGEPEKEF